MKKLILMATTLTAILLLCSCQNEKKEGVIEVESKTTIAETTIVTDTNVGNMEEETTTAKKSIYIVNEYADGELLYTTTYEIIDWETIDRIIGEWDASGYDYLGEQDEYREKEDEYIVNLFFEERIAPVESYGSYADEGAYNTAQIDFEVYEGEIYELAEATYGIPRWQTARALRLMSYEGYGLDPTLVYYLACTIVNRFIDYGMDCDIYSAWGGGDSSYGSWLDSYGMYDSAVQGLASALTNLNRDAWDVHGLCPENGYYGGCQHLDEAIYVSYVYCDVDYSGCVFACWGRDAGWY